MHPSWFVHLAALSWEHIARVPVHIPASVKVHPAQQPFAHAPRAMAAAQQSPQLAVLGVPMHAGALAPSAPACASADPPPSPQSQGP
jgi:hypothetical protein